MMTESDPLMQALLHVKQGASLRGALRATHLPATMRPRLTRLLHTLQVPYKHKGKGARAFVARQQVLALLGTPLPGRRGYWKTFAEKVSVLEGKTITPETIQLWYGRRYGNAYINQKHRAGPLT